jgi:hypothetical protein
MSSRFDWYFRQRVTEEELDRAFDQLEQADRDLASDLSVFGIISGAVATPHQPVPDLRIDITGPARAYDRLGRRIFVPVHTTVSLERDHNGLPTQVVTDGHERWMGVYMRFSRVLSDPRIDGSGNQVFFRRDESFEFVIRQAAEAPEGDAGRPPLEPDELLVCDVQRVFGQDQFLTAHIDVSRRQKFFFAQAESVGVQATDWLVDPEALNVQDALTSLDRELHNHETGQSARHHAISVECNPGGFLSGARDVQGAFDVLTAQLSDNVAGLAGARHIGADGVTGTPYALTQGTVDAQLAQLVGHVNAHQKAATAHTAEQVSATATSYITSTSVQGQLSEIVNDLAAQTAAASGAERIGVDAMSGSPTAVPAGTLRSVLSELLTALNGHATANPGAHSASAIAVADTNNRLNAQTVEGAIGETLEAIEADHYRVNEGNAGQHRTIRQPAMGVVSALLWDSRGTGSSIGRLRMISDGSGIWITLNANMTESGWVKDANGSSTALHLANALFEVKHHPANNGVLAFQEWHKSYSLGMTNPHNSTWAVGGTVVDHGRVGLEGSNPSPTTQGTVVVGASVTFRVIYNVPPSSVTLTTISSENLTMPTPSPPDQYGFHVRHSSTLAANGTKSWVGRYTTVA